MSHGHTVFSHDGDDVGVVSDAEAVNVTLLVFTLTGDTLSVRVDLREGKSNGVVYLTPVEAVRIARELRRLAIAAFEAS